MREGRKTHMRKPWRPDRLVVASHNPKKVRELRTILEPLGIGLVDLGDYPAATPPEETGATFEENALLKARYACGLAGLPALADDSGLEVAALGGAPGVRSARYAGAAADDGQNNRKLLADLSRTPPEKRAARFVSVVALVWPGGESRTWRGETTGRILDSPRGAGGFGYDPLFLSDDLGKAFAEADDAEKNRVSHRGRALAAMAAYLDGLDSA